VPGELDLILTTPPMTPETLLRHTYEQVFEEIQYKGLHLTSPQVLAQRFGTQLPALASSPCHLVVDCGYSSCHVVPFFNHIPLNFAIQRFAHLSVSFRIALTISLLARSVNVGGKVLTNYLKELVSYRHYNMMDETYLMNIIKEKMCFVSPNFSKDLATCNMCVVVRSFAVR